MSTAILRRAAELGRSDDAEVLSKIDAAHIFIVHDFFGSARHQDRAVVQDIGAINDLEGLTHVVVGYQNADSAILELRDKVADFPHGNRIDAGKGFVEQQVFRIGRQTARDFDAPPLTARQR